MKMQITMPRLRDEFESFTSSRKKEHAPIWNPGKSDSRFPELTALRGLAAVLVAVNHFCLAFWGHITYSSVFFAPLRLVVGDGPRRVVLFYVLSGFVLSASRLSGRPLAYHRFVLRRITRIYLPYLMALLLAVAADFALGGTPHGNDWLNLTWTKPLSTELVVNHIALVGKYDVAQYNTAFWSLVYEMRICLIFPVLYRCIARLSSSGAIALALLMSFTSRAFYMFEPASKLSYAVTLHYAAFFLLGGLLAKHIHTLREWMQSLPRFALYGFFLLALVCHSLPPAFRNVHGWIVEWAYAVAALLLIALAVSSPTLGLLLNHRVATRVGQVSYSLYLVHGTVLFACVILFAQRLPVWEIGIIVLFATTVMTELFYWGVEQPSIRLTKFIKATGAPAKASPAASLSRKS